MESIETEYLHVLCAEFCATQELEYFHKFSFIFQNSPRMQPHARESFLIIASAFQNVKMLQFLLQEGVNPSHQDSDGCTAIHNIAAADSRNISDANEKCIDLLIESGADISLANARGDTGMHVAVLNGNSVAIKLLIAGGIDMTTRNQDGHTALDIAQIHKDKLDNRTFQYMLEYSLGGSPVDDLGNTYLHRAIIQNRMASIKRLLMSGANASLRNNQNYTPIDIAIETLPSVSIQTVIALCTQDHLSTRDVEGNTYLHLAVRKQRYAAIIALLESNKVDVNAVNCEGLTALHYFIGLGEAGMRLGGHDILDKFMLSGFDIYKCDCDGNSFLHWAIQKTNTYALSLLLNYCSKMDMMRANTSGKTPLDVAFDVELALDSKDYLKAVFNIAATREGAQQEIIAHRDKTHGYSYLHLAVIHKRYWLVAELLHMVDDVKERKESIVDSEDAYGHPPLYYMTINTECESTSRHSIVRRMYEHAVTAIIQHTSYLTRKFQGGNTYLHLSSMHHLPLLTMHLLKAFPDYAYYALNDDNCTPMDLFLIKHDMTELNKTSVFLGADPPPQSSLLPAISRSAGEFKSDAKKPSWWIHDQYAIETLTELISRNCHIHLEIAKGHCIAIAQHWRENETQIHCPNAFRDFMKSETFIRWNTSDATRTIFELENERISRRQTQSLLKQLQVFKSRDLQTYILEFL
jgi:ankyrin repeat protein